jgi:hypothetical protein
MIIQLLGVALISLLTITPTIQQNNIEQLIAPNIEIQSNIFNTPDVNRLWVANQFSYYNSSNPIVSPIDPLLYNYNFSSVFFTSTDVTFSAASYNRLTFITNDNFYFYKTSSRTITSQAVKELVELAYITKNNGAIITSSSFSFTLNNNTLATTNTFYTYQINGSAGQVNANIYYNTTSDVSNINSMSINNNITLPANSSLQEVINELNPQITWTYSDNRFDQKILYYWLDTSLPLNNQGIYTRTLYGRDNYGNNRTFGQFTLTLTEPDTTPPVITSITGNPINWTNQDVTLTINATDNKALGDLNTPPYSFDNGITWQFTNSKTFSIMQTVNIRVRDLSGNFTNQQVVINRIDKDSPTVLLPQGWINQYERNTITAQQLLQTYVITDNFSGVNTALTTISNFNPTVNGSYNPLISVTDNVGNTFNYTSPTVTIVSPNDTEGPSITGPSSLTRQKDTISQTELLSNFIITDISGIEPNTITIRDINNNILINVWALNVGTYTLRVYARDTLNNVSTLDFQLIVTAPPLVDNESPIIESPLIVSFTIGDFLDRQEILDFYVEVTDNIALSSVLLVGDINFTEIGDYQLQIIATDTSQNQTTRNILIRIKDEVILGNYNPLTDLLSGIFGGALSMIFTIGTINVLGLRLLDAMGVIILGAVLLFVYKAIKGGS